MTHRIIGLLVTLSFLMMALVATAQPQANVPRIGWLAFGFPPSDANRQRSPFFQGLRELGWVEGHNVAIEQRYAEERATRFPDLAAELIQLKVDVMVVRDAVAIPAAKRATSTIPIVIAVSGDPVGAGYVASLARPGGHITGLTNITAQ
jgi:ABC-type uncharacterized transport system substrate-binding protein